MTHRSRHLYHIPVVARHFDVAEQARLEHSSLPEPQPYLLYAAIQPVHLLQMLHVRKEVNLLRLILWAEIDCPDGHGANRLHPPIAVPENLYRLFRYDGRAL